MKVYDRQGLQTLMGIGKDTAYRIMKEYGFRVGVNRYRISERQVERFIKEMGKDGRQEKTLRVAARP